MEKALEVAEEVGLESDALALHAEQGRVYRELGNITTMLEGPEKGLIHYRQGEHHLRQILEAPGRSIVDQVDTLQDFAEILFLSRDPKAAQQYLVQAEEMIGPEYRIIPGKPVPKESLANEYFAPLGKVEMLRGQMALVEGQYEQGLQHYVLAYAYFMRFSPEAIEKGTMVEYLYHNLRQVENKQELVESVRDWIRQFDPAMGVESLVEILENLLGV